MPEMLPNFVLIKGWILASATDLGIPMTQRRAKKMAGDYLSQNDPEMYKRFTHRDPVGEGVARRWNEFRHHNEQVPA